MNEERRAILRKIKEAYNEPVYAADKLGYKIKQQADDLDQNPKTIYGATNPKNLQHLPPIDLMIAHVNNLKAFFVKVGASVDAYAAFDQVEFLLGRVSFLLPEIPENCKEFRALMGESISEFGDVLQEGGKMVADGRVTAEEYARFETETLQSVRKQMAQLKAARDLRDRFQAESA